MRRQTSRVPRDAAGGRIERQRRRSVGRTVGWARIGRDGGTTRGSGYQKRSLLHKSYLLRDDGEASSVGLPKGLIYGSFSYLFSSPYSSGRVGREIVMDGIWHLETVGVMFFFVSPHGTLVGIVIRSWRLSLRLRLSFHGIVFWDVLLFRQASHGFHASLSRNDDTIRAFCFRTRCCVCRCECKQGTYLHSPPADRRWGQSQLTELHRA